MEVEAKAKELAIKMLAKALARRKRAGWCICYCPDPRSAFWEAAWYQGQPSNDDYLPHFASKIAGDIMRAVMQKHPTCKLLVLCGHTHGISYGRYPQCTKGVRCSHVVYPEFAAISPPNVNFL